MSLGLARALLCHACVFADKETGAVRRGSRYAFMELESVFGTSSGHRYDGTTGYEQRTFTISFLSLMHARGPTAGATFRSKLGPLLTRDAFLTVADSRGSHGIVLGEVQCSPM